MTCVRAAVAALAVCAQAARAQLVFVPASAFSSTNTVGGKIVPATGANLLSGFYAIRIISDNGIQFKRGSEWVTLSATQISSTNMIANLNAQYLGGMSASGLVAMTTAAVAQVIAGLTQIPDPQLLVRLDEDDNLLIPGDISTYGVFRYTWPTLGTDNRPASALDLQYRGGTGPATITAGEWSTLVGSDASSAGGSRSFVYSAKNSAADGSWAGVLGGVSNVAAGTNSLILGASFGSVPAAGTRAVILGGLGVTNAAEDGFIVGSTGSRLSAAARGSALIGVSPLSAFTLDAARSAVVGASGQLAASGATNTFIFGGSGISALGLGEAARHIFIAGGDSVSAAGSSIFVRGSDVVARGTNLVVLGSTNSIGGTGGARNIFVLGDSVSLVEGLSNVVVISAMHGAQTAYAGSDVIHLGTPTISTPAASILAGSAAAAFASVSAGSGAFSLRVASPTGLFSAIAVTNLAAVRGGVELSDGAGASFVLDGSAINIATADVYIASGGTASGNLTLSNGMLTVRLGDIALSPGGGNLLVGSGISFSNNGTASITGGVVVAAGGAGVRIDGSGITFDGPGSFTVSDGNIMITQGSLTIANGDLLIPNGAYAGEIDKNSILDALDDGDIIPLGGLEGFVVDGSNTLFFAGSMLATNDTGTNVFFGSGRGLSGVDALTLGGLTPQELVPVGATYYVWGSVTAPAGDVPVTGAKLLTLVSPADEALHTTTVPDPANGDVIALVAIPDDEKPDILSKGIVTVHVTCAGEGHGPYVARPYLRIYSDATTVETEIAGEAFTVSPDGVYTHDDVSVVISDEYPLEGKHLAGVLKAESGWGGNGNDFMVQSQDGALTYITLPSVGAGVYVPWSTWLEGNRPHLYVDGITYTNTYWDDMTVSSLNLVNVPGDYEPVSRMVGASYVWEFDNQGDVLYGALQVPHKYKRGTDLHPHIHMASTANAVTSFWTLAVNGAAIGSNITHNTYSQTVGWTNASSNVHTMVNFPVFPGANLGESAVLLFSLTRENALSGPGNPYLLDVDFHYEIDKPGSDNANPYE